MGLQAQQEEQQDEIRSLKTHLTEMQEQLEEARNSNAEMKAMLVKVLAVIQRHSWQLTMGSTQHTARHTMDHYTTYQAYAGARS